jgi:nitrous oxide reductase accessory protein NosL
MKKALFLIVFAAMCLSSCKKEETAAPVKIEKASMGGGATRNMGAMD